MYILIDRERMVLLHKHASLYVLADVAWIECHNSAYCIFGVDDATGFRDFTDMELRMLYHNITGLDYGNRFNRTQLLQILYDLTSRISESDINAVEAERQAEHVAEGDERKWIYVRGAKRPAEKPDLFAPACRRASRSESEEERAKAGELPALKRKVRPRSPSTGGDRPAPATQQRAPGASGPKRGTAKAIIWATADKLWEEAGKPTDKPTILALRKQIMDTLENDEAIKRASSSSELGVWHKTRAPY